MSAAADAEDKTEKHPVTPGVPKPARELYGVMLLESGNAKEALAAFEATLKKEPNRLGAYVGAAKAAEKSGDTAKAQEYYKKVVAIAGDADKSRVEVGEARAFLTRSREASTSHRSREQIVRALLPLFVLGALPAPAQAESRQVLGYAGALGEWELTATVTRKGTPMDQGILRTIVDEARRYLHAGWTGGEDRAKSVFRFRHCRRNWMQRCWLKAWSAPTAHDCRTPIAG